MKKFIFVSVMLLAVLSGCKQTSTEELVAQYEESTQAIIDAYNVQIEAIQSDSTATQESVGEAMAKYYEEAVEKYVDTATEFIRKNSTRVAAVHAVKDIYSMLEPEELNDVLGMLKGEAAKDSTVLKMRKSLESVLATAPGAMFTDFTIVQDPEDAEASTVKFSDYIGQGKYMLVDFWASWCGPCKREIPNIISVYNTYKGDKFDVLSVAVWDEPAATKAAAIEHGVVWNQIINAQRIPTDIYGIQGIPQIMLFGPDGTILKRDLRGEKIEAAVREALGL